MAKSEIQRLAELVLPSFGYFGCHPFNQLEIEIQNEVDRIELVVQRGAPEYLNLGQISFRGRDGVLLNRPNSIHRAVLTSRIDADLDLDVTEQVLKGQSIHSGLEISPRLTIIFNKPVFIEKLHIANRSGEHGKRSTHIVATAWHGADQVHRHLNGGTTQRIAMLTELAAKVGVNNISEDLNSEHKCLVKASEIQQKIGEAVRNKSIILTNAQAYALLPIYDKDPLINGNILSFAGAAIASAVFSVKEIQTGHLRELSSILASSASIEAASNVARDVLATHHEMDGLVVGKHKIGQSNLTPFVDEYASVIEIVISQLNEWGIQSMLCYGTLLGAVRSESFIAHDDDVDMLYIDDSSTEQEMRANREQLLAKFREAGYNIWDSGTNFHVTPPSHKVGIDLFPCFTQGKSTHLMMERYKYRSINTDIILPIGSTILYGKSYPAPNDPEQFLAERYGARWRTPDPYYEWPWPLRTTETWPSRTSQSRLEANRTMAIAWGQHLGPGKNSPPKNSAALVKAAIGYGFDAVELDTRLSKDNKFVLGHDDLLTLPDDQQVRISDRNARELKTFSLGEYAGEPSPIHQLSHAINLLGDKILHLDPRCGPESYALLRDTIDSTSLDPSKIVFCGYDFDCVSELVRRFPESVILKKYYANHHFVDNFVLDELAERQIDGLMLYWPMHHEQFDRFVERVKERKLKILFYCHGAWPSRGEVDNSNQSLKKMMAAKVDFVTTTAIDTKSFKSLVSQPLSAV